MLTFDEWIKNEMDRGLSRLEVEQMRDAWNAALAVAGVPPSADTERLDWLERNAKHAHFQHSYMRDGAMVYVIGDGATPRGHGPTVRAAIDYARGVPVPLNPSSNPADYPPEQRALLGTVGVQEVPKC